ATPPRLRPRPDCLRWCRSPRVTFPHDVRPASIRLSRWRRSDPVGFTVHGSRFRVRSGSEFLVPGSRFYVPASKFTLNVERRTPNAEPRTPNLERRTRTNLEP